MSTPPEIIEKIKKLLALAARGEPHEAALALQMAQRLMAQHNVTAEEAEVGKVGAERLRSVATVSRAKGWELRLYSGIADCFGVGLMFEAGRRRDVYGELITDSRIYAHYLFIGPKAEAQLAQYAAHVLQRQLTRAKTKFTDSLSPELGRMDKAGEVDAYALGWVVAALCKVEKLVPNPARSKAIARFIDETKGEHTVKTAQTRCSTGPLTAERRAENSVRVSERCPI